jgi:hypothetical protein
MYYMNRLSVSVRARIIAALVEGNSLRSTSRLCDVAFNTVLKLVPEIGIACADYHDTHVRRVRAKRIQCDEIWQFVGAKAIQTYLKFASAGRLSDDLVVKTRTREGDRWRHSQGCLAACCSLYTTVLTRW